MTNNILEQATNSLERVQNFDATSLKREGDLGLLHFGDAVEPARKTINLFQQFPIQYLKELPDSKLNDIIQQADSFFNILSQILDFNPKQENPGAAQTQLLNTMENQHNQVFNKIYQLIAYGSSRQRDVEALEQQFRVATQQATDKANELIAGLEVDQKEAQRILEEVRDIAAEQGVSQQAKYFAKENEAHEKEAILWRWWTIATAVMLGIFAITSTFAHKIPILAPTNTYETIQLSLSKLLIFAVVGYMLFLCARNFLSHKHNAIINKHRQNALLTFNALVDAARSEDRRDVVLTYAASCIFSPQETGYARTSATPQPDAPLNIFQAIPRFGQNAP